MKGKKKEKKNIAVCFSVLSGSVLFFDLFFVCLFVCLFVCWVFLTIMKVRKVKIGARYQRTL